MATKYKVNYELKGDSSVPVTRTGCIKHGNNMLDTVIDNLSNDNKFVEYDQHDSTINETKIALNGYQHISKNAYGLRENATGLGVMVNSSGDPEVMNVDTKGLSEYHDRDIVGAYISADGKEPLYTVPMNKVTYRSDGCTVNYDMPDLINGMIIDTSDGNYVGIVETFDNTTGVIVLEDGWYHKSTHVKGIPAGTGFWVQKISKVWGINVNVGLPSGIKTNAAAIEAGLYNNGSTGQDRGIFDAVLLKGDGDYGLRARGNFFYGFLADGSNIGYCYRPANDEKAAFDVALPNGKHFVIGANGSINRTVKSVSQKGSATLDIDNNFVIEASENATLTLPESAPVGTILEIFIASSNNVTLKAPGSETIWYGSGYNNTCSFSGINHSLFRVIKGLETQWIVFIQNMANISEVKFTNSEKENVISSYSSSGISVKNLCPVNTASITQPSFIFDTDAYIPKGEYVISWSGTSNQGQTEVKFKNSDVEVASILVDNSGSISRTFNLTSDINHISAYCSSANTISNMMIRDARTNSDYEEYKPNLQTQIKNLAARLSALENK